MERIPVREARRNFSHTLNRVGYGGERIVLQRNGKDLAVLVPVEDAEFLEELGDRIDVEAARKALLRAADMRASRTSDRRADRHPQKIDVAAAERERGRAWVRIWKKAGPILAGIQAQELAAITEDRARRAILDVLDLWAPPEEPSMSSGLVEQQRHFARFQRVLQKGAGPG